MLITNILFLKTRSQSFQTKINLQFTEKIIQVNKYLFDNYFSIFALHS